MAEKLSPLERLVEAVLASRKYRQVSPGLVRSLGKRELETRGRLKEAVKAVKNKLHQVGGAYQDARLDYLIWLEHLRQAYHSMDREAFLSACRDVMAHHASTRERLPILDDFYRLTLQDLPPIRSVVDVACGLNPLALPWMGLDPQVEYFAVDIYHDMMDFINKFMALIQINGATAAADVIEFSFKQEVDLALVLKTIPCLEQIDRAAGERLLESLPAKNLLVSFPVHSLGGRSVGMVENYEARFHELAAGKQWNVRRFEFETELAFLVSR